MGLLFQPAVPTLLTMLLEESSGLNFKLVISMSQGSWRGESI